MANPLPRESKEDAGMRKPGSVGDTVDRSLEGPVVDSSI